LGAFIEFKADLLIDVNASRQRTSDLIKLSAHSFDVILGALLGFLSAGSRRPRPANGQRS
jgi:hypothetical protein